MDIWMDRDGKMRTTCVDTDDGLRAPLIVYTDGWACFLKNGKLDRSGGLARFEYLAMAEEAGKELEFAFWVSSEMLSYEPKRETVIAELRHAMGRAKRDPSKAHPWPVRDPSEVVGVTGNDGMDGTKAGGLGAPGPNGGNAVDIGWWKRLFGAA